MLTAERLRKLLYYDQEAGIFTRRATQGHARAGDVAGWIEGNGYHKIVVDGHNYLAHRLAWLYVTGRLPAAEIDHINRVKDDNRFCNLRESTRAQNLWNSRGHVDSFTGVKGIFLGHSRNRAFWRVEIMANGKRHTRRCPPAWTLEEAAAFRAKLVQEIHQDFARAE